MIDWIIGLVVVLIAVLAVGYMVRAKKNGAVCIGCSACSSKKSKPNSSSSCGGCGGQCHH